MAKWRAACLLAACPPPSPPRLDRPSHLPVDNPAGFSYFFDISGRRTCTVAPERFYAPDGKSATTEVCRFNALAPAMDIFSLGCVIYELMTDGKPLFDLPTLLAYREVPGPPTRPAVLAHPYPYRSRHCVRSAYTHSCFVARARYRWGERRLITTRFVCACVSRATVCRVGSARRKHWRKSRTRRSG